MKERSTVAMEFLKVMRKLEQSSEIPSVVKVKDWLVENLDGLSVAVLADLYQMYINSPVSEERSSILTQTLERLRSGVLSPEDTFHLLVRSRDADLIDMFLPVIKANLGKMQFREFSLLMQSMASVQDRNKVIINMICSSLADRFEELEVRKKPVAQVVSLVESLARLHIYNGDLLEKLAQVLVRNKRFMSAAQVLELLSSLSHLRLRDPMLLAFIDSEIDQKHMVLGRAFPKKLADVLLSFANLNYVPEYSWISEPMFWSYFETTPVQHKHVWLDMIWSLVILNKALPDQIQSVLSPSFYEPLLKTFEEKDAGVQQNLACRKLLQINASANLDMEGTYEGELLPEDFITRYNVKPPSIPKVSLVHALSKVVKLQAVSEDCFKENVFLDSGHLIHVELLLNQQGFYEPLDKEHSDDVFRVAVIVMDFPFMTLGDVQPVGAFALTIRHLEKLGYLVVEIPYTELGVESKVNVLSNALKRAVQSRIADQLSEAV
ncbi:FAST kinase domain-containing protein 4-like [Lingula anatina]|uniref:FAST kinase domain-containing protein 4-like n=1 Tax=Lingula anatina TaxID=7574 RepID=A0A1S3JB08_LINAN|nr:FAST kinase domain-containing protein 4-like [Lingula anatina]|eukprot:XP_013407582.1 FAST kinase domain-containing protein 4-like [Lingula anatina]